MRSLRWIVVALLALGLGACGPARKSVFPPALSIQQLKVQPDGRWHLVMRIQNNSYTGVRFTALEGELTLERLLPVRLHARFDRDIPTLAGDVVELDLLPTPPMADALRALDAKGSAGALGYAIEGTVTGAPETKPGQYDDPRDFPFHANDWLSPVPGLPATYR